MSRVSVSGRVAVSGRVPVSGRIAVSGRLRQFPSLPNAVFVQGWDGPFYTDAGRTTLATAVDAPVRTGTNRSLVRLHPTAGSDSLRPLLKHEGGWFRSLLFDGSDDRLDIANNLNFSPDAVVFWGTTWLKIPSLPGSQQTALNKFDTASNRREWRVGPALNGFPRLQVSASGTSSTTSVDGGTALTVNQWGFVYWYISGTHLGISLDLGTVANTPFPFPITVQNTPFIMGMSLAAGAASQQFVGRIGMTTISKGGVLPDDTLIASLKALGPTP